jgi:triosephosphate isomerase
MRRKIFGGNWKMNLNYDKIKALVSNLVKEIGNIEDRDIVLFPPFPYIKDVVEMTKGSNIKVGAQNMYYEDNGAYTGEVSPLMLKDVGCEYVILGHSERRHIFNENNDIINKKIQKAIEHNLNIIFCVGELLEEREKGKTEEILNTQIKSGLDGISDEDILKITIAYEPVWAIGTGIPATPEDAEKSISYIRNLIKKLYGENIANQIRIQYGGSVNKNNIQNIINMPNIDGALVGSKSLIPEEFSQITLS